MFVWCCKGVSDGGGGTPTHGGVWCLVWGELMKCAIYGGWIQYWLFGIRNI